MEKNCVADFYIKPTDTAAAIPVPRNDLINLIRAFRYFNRDKALDTLFRFKYGTMTSKKEALNWFSTQSIEDGKVIYNASTTSEIVNFTDEQFILLADELQIQYQERDPLFLDIHSIRGLPKNGCQEELSMLQEKMGNNPLLFFMAVRRCVRSKKNPDASQWGIELLSNNSEAQTLALKNLGFGFNYRICLKPYSIEIGTLLLAMRQIYLKRQRLLGSNDALTLPLITLLRQMIELDIQVNSYFKKNKKKYHHSDAVAIFESNVLHFIEVAVNVTHDDLRFKTFAECQQKLEVLGNKIISLLQSQIEYKTVFAEGETDSILYTVVMNPYLSQKMCNAEKDYQKARAAYYSAFEDFQAFLFEHFAIK